MNAAELARLELLRGDGSVTIEYLNDSSGLGWPWSGELRQDFDAWLALSPRRTRWDDDRPSRFLIEGFLRDQRLESTKWAACRLGMEESSFAEVLVALPRIGLRLRRYEVYPGLISTSFGKDLDGHLPSMKFRTFDDHETYCQFLHEDLRTRLGVTIQPQWCATSLRLADSPMGYPRAIARDFDCITLEPLSVRHQMFLDFRKPLYLKIDVCSKLFYAENRSDLEPYRSGSAEPHDLPDYEAQLYV